MCDYIWRMNGQKSRLLSCVRYTKEDKQGGDKKKYTLQVPCNLYAGVRIPELRNLLPWPLACLLILLTWIKRARVSHLTLKKKKKIIRGLSTRYKINHLILHKRIIVCHIHENGFNFRQSTIDNFLTCNRLNNVNFSYPWKNRSTDVR